MFIQVLTLFPEIFSGFLNSSLIAKGIQKEIIRIELIQIRDFSNPPHNQVDDSPFGGGAGMTMKVEPLVAATRYAKQKAPHAPVILMSPSGAAFNQSKATSFSKQLDLILVCGRYEGIDQRYIDMCVDEEISIGDFVLMGGEVASMAVIEATTRLIDGMIGNQESLTDESFGIADNNLLEYPQYTRPAEFEGHKVPEILLSGDHQKIKQWRLEQSKLKTKIRRPDLLK
jgi:tRNA (guanine37-N1)-methyltransferase